MHFSPLTPSTTAQVVTKLEPTILAHASSSSTSSSSSSSSKQTNKTRLNSSVGNTSGNISSSTAHNRSNQYQIGNTASNLIGGPSNAILNGHAPLALITSNVIGGITLTAVGTIHQQQQQQQQQLQQQQQKQNLASVATVLGLQQPFANSLQSSASEIMNCGGTLLGTYNSGQIMLQQQQQHQQQQQQQQHQMLANQIQQHPNQQQPLIYQQSQLVSSNVANGNNFLLINANDLSTHMSINSLNGLGASNSKSAARSAASFNINGANVSQLVSSLLVKSEHENEDSNCVKYTEDLTDISFDLEHNHNNELEVLNSNNGNNNMNKTANNVEQEQQSNEDEKNAKSKTLVKILIAHLTHLKMYRKQPAHFLANLIYSYTLPSF